MQDGRDWIHLTKNCIHCLALVNTVVNKIMVFWILCPVVRWRVHGVVWERVPDCMVSVPCMPCSSVESTWHYMGTRTRLHGVSAL